MPLRLALCLLLTAPTLVCGGDWPQFLGPHRNGLSDETGLLQSWSKQGPKVLWKKEVGEGYSGPVVAGDRLIVFHRIGDKEIVECWSAGDGQAHWRHAYSCEYVDSMGKGNGPRATPTIADRRAVTLGANGDLTCLDLEKGSVNWTKNILKEYPVPESYFGVGTSPVVDDNLVLVNVGAKNAGIVAFRLADGTEAWKATSDGASYSSPVICSIDGVKQAVFLTREGVVILDPKTGAVRHQQRWRARYAASVNAASPLIFANHAFFSASYETGALLLRLKKDGAEQLWTSQDLMSNHYNTCVAHKEHLYGFDGRQEAGPSFRCVDLKEQKVAWEKKGFGCGSMILAEGNLIVLTEAGELLLVEATPARYHEFARAKIFNATPVRAQIALAHGRLFARDQKHLACFELKK